MANSIGYFVIGLLMCYAIGALLWATLAVLAGAILTIEAVSKLIKQGIKSCHVQKSQ